MGKISDLLKHVTTSASSGPPAANENDPSWLNHVAMLTGAMAALAGFLTVRGTILANEAIYESNQAILSQTQASDAWNEYEAQSIKAHITEVQMLQSPIAPSTKSQLESMSAALRGREPELKKSAEDKIAERDDHLNRAHFQLDEKDLVGYAGVTAQLGIALASVAALVKKRMAFHVAIVVAAVSVGITAYTFISDYLASR